MLDVDEEKDNKEGCAFYTKDYRIGMEAVLERPTPKADSRLD
jgi:hypothetical protein